MDAVLVVDRNHTPGRNSPAAFVAIWGHGVAGSKHLSHGLCASADFFIHGWLFSCKSYGASGVAQPTCKADSRLVGESTAPSIGGQHARDMALVHVDEQHRHCSHDAATDPFTG